MAEDIMQLVAELERQLIVLNKAMEQYFLGIERVPPAQERESYRARLAKVRGNIARESTAVRFRTANLWARFMTYDTMWARTLKQIEDGTYRRNLARVRHKKALEEQTQPDMAPAPKAESAAASAQASDQPAAQPPPPAQPAVARPQAPRARPAAAATPAEISDAKLKQIYDTFIVARRRTKESTDVSYESLSKQLRQRAQQMKVQHGCDNIDFKIVIKGGKTMIKAVPKGS